MLILSVSFRNVSKYYSFAFCVIPYLRQGNCLRKARLTFIRELIGHLLIYFQLKRFSAQSLGTTYVYDFPELFQQVIRYM